MRRKDLREYGIWKGMKSRCYNQNRVTYRRYGGRGIKVCERWKDDFWAFYEDMGQSPANCAIDRIDNDGDYTPDNCRWTTRRINNNNGQRNLNITFKGRTLTLSQWARLFDLTPRTLLDRLESGWLLDKALSSKRHGVHMIEFNGKIMSATEWGNELGVTRKAISTRIKRWGIEAALSVAGKQHKSNQTWR